MYFTDPKPVDHCVFFTRMVKNISRKEGYLSPLFVQVLLVGNLAEIAAFRPCVPPW